MEEPPHDLPEPTKSQCMVVAVNQLMNDHPWLFMPDEEPRKWMEQSLFCSAVDNNFDLRGSYPLRCLPFCRPALEMLLAPGQAFLQTIVGEGPISQQRYHGDPKYHRFIVLRDGRNPPPECGDCRTEMQPFQYCQNHQWTKNDVRGFTEFECLGHPKEIKQPGSTFCKALGLAAIALRQVATAVDANNQPLWADATRQNDLHNEAFEILQYLVREGYVNPSQDLRFILENFGWTKSLLSSQQEWCSQMLIAMLVRGCLHDLPDHQEVLKGVLEERIQEEPDMYPTVDVRAWPLILIDFLHLSPTRIQEIVDPFQFGNQLMLQLCTVATAQLEANHLEVAKILNKLELQQKCFSPLEFFERFNDPTWNRLLLLRSGLQSAPTAFRQEVLQLIDGDIDQLDIGRDEGAQLLQGLIDHLREDLRSCPNLFYAVKRNWIRARVTDMSPEQLCDYIETDPNHHLLLKDVVNRLHNLKQFFQAAKILVRKRSQGTSCFEAHQNDPLLGYLRELYSDADEVPDRFGPIEEGSIILPITANHPNFFRIADPQGADIALQQLSRDFGFDGAAAQASIVGVYWQWLCYDARQDFWPQASAISMAYQRASDGQTVFAFFDLFMLDTSSGLSDAGARVFEESKRLIRRILEAHHILKVVHDMNSQSLAVLQRAVAPAGCFYKEEQRARIEPFMEVALLLAFVRSTTPTDPGCFELTNAVRDYLRMELCTSEAMSNPDRRPLRSSQIHYALTMAWCPLLIARVLCSSDSTFGDTWKAGLIWPHEVGQFIFSSPPEGHDWSHHLWNSSFGKASHSDYPPIDAPVRKDLWFEVSEEAQEYRKNLPEPMLTEEGSTRARLPNHLDHLRAIRVDESSSLKQYVDSIIAHVCFPKTIAIALKSLYDAQEQGVQVVETGEAAEAEILEV